MEVVAENPWSEDVRENDVWDQISDRLDARYRIEDPTMSACTSRACKEKIAFLLDLFRRDDGEALKK